MWCTCWTLGVLLRIYLIFSHFCWNSSLSFYDHCQFRKKAGCGRGFNSHTQFIFIILVSYGIISSSFWQDVRRDFIDGRNRRRTARHSLQGFRPCSKMPSSCVVAALMSLPLLLSLRPRPQQHNSDNQPTTTTTLYSILAIIVISFDVIIILPIALLELTRPLFRMVHFVLRVTTTSHERTIRG
jgi:hypothetical protein